MRLWALRIGRWFRRIDPRCFDVIHVTTENNALALPAISRRTGLPFSVYVDTTTSLFCREFGHHPLTGAPNRAAEEYIFRHAALVACMSSWARGSVVADYGVAEERTMLARSAVELPQVDVERRMRRAPGPVRIAFVGNDWVRKGGDRLVRWHQEHCVDRAEVHLFGRNIPALPPMKNVVVHGSVERGRLMGEFLPSMDVFALPTREDMTPWAIVEAAALMLPVVSSRVGAIGELVIHGRTGLLALPGDDAGFAANMRLLVENEQLRQEMAVAARVYAVQEFEPSRWYNALLDRLKVIAAARLH
jgi:glycosyltransferase involved in cell wall biosynthesis